MKTDFIGDLIDKLSIINVKIWDATQKAHIAYKEGNDNAAHELFTMVEAMNIQRKDYINEINMFFTDKVNQLNQKSYTSKSKKVKRSV